MSVLSVFEFVMLIMHCSKLVFQLVVADVQSKFVRGRRRQYGKFHHGLNKQMVVSKYYQNGTMLYPIVSFPAIVILS